MKNCPPTVLVVDDESSLQYAFRRLFEGAGWRVEAATTGRKALEAAARAPAPEIIFLDVRLPDVDGLELLPQLRRIVPEAGVIMMTAYGTLETAVRAVDGDVLEYMIKPVDLDRALEIADSCLAAKSEDAAGREATRGESARDAFIGHCPCMQQVFRSIGLMAGTEATVLITGETGTGKEMVARAIHNRSRRAAGPFVAVNCGALPEQLVESELFGHVKGAFTGADSGRGGRFEAAGGGTLFLDEVGELPLAAQVKLLRFLDGRTIERLGSVVPVEVDVRVVAATNRNLEEAVRSGAFRADLFYRLAVMRIALPPLRDRLQDVPELAKLFLDQFAAGQAPVITAPAMQILLAHEWPGNVRELRNVMQHATVVARGGAVLPWHLPMPDACRAGGRETGSGTDRDALAAYLDSVDCHAGTAMSETVGPVEGELIRRAVAKFAGNRSAAAAYLGIHRNTLRNKMGEV